MTIPLPLWMVVTAGLGEAGLAVWAVAMTVAAHRARQDTRAILDQYLLHRRRPAALADKAFAETYRLLEQKHVD